MLAAQHDFMDEEFLAVLASRKRAANIQSTREPLHVAGAVIITMALLILLFYVFTRVGMRRKTQAKLV